MTSDRWWRTLRWWEVAPEVVVGLGLGLFLVIETDAATSAFRSTTALVLMAVTATAWLALRVLTARLGPRWATVRTALFGLAAVAVLAVVVVPAFDDTTVVEQLVVDLEPSAPPPVEGTPSPAPTQEPVLLATGSIAGIDHRASGIARLYRQPSGALVVGLEEIDIQPGPDYDVFVVPGEDRSDIAGGTRLDDLRGNKGTQFYDVPASVELEPGEWTVLVWCQTFDVPVAAATPR